MIAAPRHTPDHADHALECEQALEPRLQAMLDEMEKTGMSRDGAARWLAKVIADPAIDRDVIAPEIEDARRAAEAAGWDAGTIAMALASLGVSLPRAFESEGAV